MPKLLFAISFLCIFVIYHLSWESFRLSHISKQVMVEYQNLPKNCYSGSTTRGHFYVCDKDIDLLKATEKEKYWIRMHGRDVIIFLVLSILSVFLIERFIKPRSANFESDEKIDRNRVLITEFANQMTESEKNNPNLSDEEKGAIMARFQKHMTDAKKNNSNTPDGDTLFSKQR